MRTQEQKRLRSILTLGIIAITSNAVAVITIIVGAIIFASTVQPGAEIIAEMLKIIPIFVGIIISVVGGILSFISAILILASDFHNAEVDKNKVVFGVLSIFFLGGILQIIFASINLKKLAAKKSKKK